MAVYVAFLRGVNVAGRRKIKMADLKTAHEAIDHANVATYLQSGNVVFESTTRGKAKLIAGIEGAYRKCLGLDTAVMLRSLGELEKLIERCPLKLGTDREAKFLHAVLLADKPGRAAAKNLLGFDGPEEFAIAGDTLYVYYMHGSGRSKLSLAFVERTLGVKATARNWNTITKLHDIAAQR